MSRRSPPHRCPTRCRSKPLRPFRRSRAPSFRPTAPRSRQGRGQRQADARGHRRCPAAPSRQCSRRARSTSTGGAGSTTIGWLSASAQDEIVRRGDLRHPHRRRQADLPKLVPIGWTRQRPDCRLTSCGPRRDGSPRILLRSDRLHLDQEDCYPSVWEADLSTGDRMTADPDPDVVDWDADAEGNVRLAISAISDAPLASLYRRDKQQVRDDPARERGQGRSRSRVYPRRRQRDRHRRRGGRDEVYELACRPSRSARSCSATKYDVDDVIANSRRRRLDGSSGRSQDPRRLARSPVEAIQADLDESVGVGNGRIISRSRDRKKMLVESRSRRRRDRSILGHQWAQMDASAATSPR